MYHGGLTDQRGPGGAYALGVVGVVVLARAD
jgi:hypothetical protein